MWKLWLNYFHLRFNVEAFYNILNLLKIVQMAGLIGLDLEIICNNSFFETDFQNVHRHMSMLHYIRKNVVKHMFTKSLFESASNDVTSVQERAEKWWEKNNWNEINRFIQEKQKVKRRKCTTPAKKLNVERPLIVLKWRKTSFSRKFKTITAKI